MGKYISLLLFIGLAFWGCEEEADTTPPTVSITSHESGQSVSEVITITVTSEDDYGVSKVEFYVNGYESDNLMKTDGLNLFIITEVSIIKMFTLENMRSQEYLLR